ncbi:MAG TPA: hypothetical protein VGD46_00535, partial [Rhizobacter sp.]
KTEAKGGGWDLTHPGTGEVLNFKTQDALQERIRADKDFADGLHSGLIEAVMNSGEVIEADE